MSGFFFGVQQDKRPGVSRACMVFGWEKLDQCLEV